MTTKRKNGLALAVLLALIPVALLLWQTEIVAQTPFFILLCALLFLVIAIYLLRSLVLFFDEALNAVGFTFPFRMAVIYLPALLFFAFLTVLDINRYSFTLISEPFLVVAVMLALCIGNLILVLGRLFRYLSRPMRLQPRTFAAFSLSAFLLIVYNLWSLFSTSLIWCPEAFSYGGNVGQLAFYLDMLGLAIAPFLFSAQLLQPISLWDKGFLMLAAGALGLFFLFLLTGSIIGRKQDERRTLTIKRGPAKKRPRSRAKPLLEPPSEAALNDIDIAAIQTADDSAEETNAVRTAVKMKADAKPNRKPLIYLASLGIALTATQLISKALKDNNK